MKYHAELVSKHTWQLFEYDDNDVKVRPLGGKHRQASKCAKDALKLLRKEREE